MIVFKYFWTIIEKQKMQIIVYLGIFIGLMLLFVGTGNEMSEDFTTRAMNVGIVDLDDSTLSGSIISYLDTQHNLSMMDNNETEIEEALFFRKIEYVLIIPSGFEAGLLGLDDHVNLETMRAPDSVTSFYLDHQLETFVITLRTYLGAGFSVDTAVSYTKGDLAEGIIVEVSLSDGNSYAFFNFLAYILVSLLISVIGAIIITHNKKEILRRVDVSSTSMVSRNIQLTLGCMIAAIGLWILVLAIPFFIYNVDTSNPVLMLRIVNSFALLLVSVSMAFLFGTICKNMTVLNAVSSVVVMGFAFLTGVFIPVEFLSDEVVRVARFLPTFWFTHNNSLLDQTYSITQVDTRAFTEGALIQVGFALAIFAVTLVIIRQKRTMATA